MDSGPMPNAQCPIEIRAKWLDTVAPEEREVLPPSGAVLISKSESQATPLKGLICGKGGIKRAR